MLVQGGAKSECSAWLMTTPRARLLVLALLLSTLALACQPVKNVPSAPPPTGADLPNFQDSVVLQGLDHPTAVEFSTDGRVFVAEKSGLIKVFTDLGDTTSTVFADLRTNVHNFWDRGLLGLALDPRFPTAPFVYVLYTHDAAIGETAPRWGVPGTTSDGCPTPPGALTNGCIASIRLSRLEAADDTMVGEDVLIEDWCQQGPSHSAGTIAFGADGALYASAGEGAMFTLTDWGQAGIPPNPCGDPPGGVGATLTPPTAQGGSLRSQDLRTAGDPVTLDGSIIRVDPTTGAAMPGNPLAGNSDLNARRIVAHGLRNPFRFTVRPGTNELWVGDPGAGAFDEINRIAAPAAAPVENFGWPCYEGASRQPGFDAADLALCEQIYATPGVVTPPYYSYPVTGPVVPGEPCPVTGAISGVAFYAGGSYPPVYTSALFFTDYHRGCVWAMLAGANGLPDPATTFVFRTDVASPVDLTTGPGGDLFYVDFDGGTVRRIQYGPNRAPSATLRASATAGPVPITVEYDATESSDPDADGLTYAWDLDGDGQFDDSTDPAPSHTYTAAGVYTVGVRVTDQRGATGIATEVLTLGVNKPVAVIDSPAPTLLWKVGDTVTFAGRGTDAEDGTVPASNMSWSLVLHHCSVPAECHEHPIQSFEGVAGGSFAAPDHAYPSHLEMELTVTDSSGLTDVASVRLDPQTVDLTFLSSPSGVELALGLDTATTPFARTMIVGSTTTVSAPTSALLGGTQYVFERWSDDMPASHQITASESPATYTATYEPR